ncbi:hypothetical protein FMO13_17615 [Xanthomonas phaseoli pv. dieffenbachiae]
MKEANVPMEEGNIWRRKRPAHFDRTFGILPSTAWPAHGIAAPPCVAQGSACPALHCPALPCPALLCLRFSGAPYRCGKAGRYDPKGGAHGCATFL